MATFELEVEVYNLKYIFLNSVEYHYSNNEHAWCQDPGGF